jgi:hypothetical protein
MAETRTSQTVETGETQRECVPPKGSVRLKRLVIVFIASAREPKKALEHMPCGAVIPVPPLRRGSSTREEITLCYVSLALDCLTSRALTPNRFRKNHS